MNTDCKMIYESYGTIYRGPKTEQDSKDYSMKATIIPYMHIIKQLSRGAFDTDSEQDTVSKGELQGVFEVNVVDGHRQVVLTNDAIKAIEQTHPELKDKFWECGKCKADYAGCGEAKRKNAEEAQEEHLVHVHGPVHDLGNGYSIHFDEIREPDNRYYSIDVYKNTHNDKYVHVTSFYPSGDDADKMRQYVQAENSKYKQLVIDQLNKYKLDLPDITTKHAHAEDEQRRIDPKCWKGYHKVGTKMKSGVRVNNCIKNS